MKPVTTLIAIIVIQVISSYGKLYAQFETKTVKVITNDGKTVEGFIQKPVTDTIITIQKVGSWNDSTANTLVPVYTIDRIEIAGKKTSFFGRTLLGLGGGTVAGAIIGLTYKDEDCSWFDILPPDRLRAVVWGAGIGAVLGLIAGIASKEAAKSFHFANQRKLSSKQKRKLDAVSF